MKRPRCGDLSLRAKLIIGLGVMLAPLLAIVASAALSLDGFLDAVREAVEEVTEEIQPVYELRSLLPRPRAAVQRFFFTGDPAARDAYRTHRAEVDRLFEAALKTVPFAREEEARLFAQAKAEWAIAADLGETVEHAPPFKWAEAAATLSRFEEHMATIDSLFARLMRLAREEIEKEHERVLVGARSMMIRLAVIFGLGVLTAIGAGILLSRAILSPIRKLDEAVRRLGEGDLAGRAPVARRDELGRLAEAFNYMAHKLEHNYAVLQELSVRDALTEVYNRRAFLRRLTAEAQRGHRDRTVFSLLMIDIDRFKEINDAHGHLAGDGALRAIAGRLKRGVRPTDLVARYGGEEFCVLLPGSRAREAIAVAERLRRAVAATPLCEEGHAVAVATISVGVAAFPEDAQSAEELVSAADRALYRAKRAGRNRVEGCTGAAPDDSQKPRPPRPDAAGTATARPAERAHSPPDPSDGGEPDPVKGPNLASATR